MKKIPYIAIGGKELGEEVGTTAKCPNCGKNHNVKYGTDSKGKETKLLGFVHCGNEIYLASIQGKQFTPSNQQ